MKKNDIITLKITDMDYQGLGIGHLEDYTVFVENAILDELVEAQILKISKNLIFAKRVNIMQKSPYRIDSSCPYYPKCGGCDLRHTNYDFQLSFKEQSLKNTLNKMIKEDLNIKNIIPADNCNYYRNKIQTPLQFIDNSIKRGFYAKRSHRLIPIKNCLLEPIYIQKLYDELLPLIEADNITIYNEESHKGQLRHIVVRTNSKQDIMLIFVVSENIKNKLYQLIEKIKTPLKSIYLNINTEKTNVILGEKFIHLANDLCLEEKIDDLIFKIHPNSFFQINYKQMLNLYDRAISLAKVDQNKSVIDAYCGIGTISLLLAKRAKWVYGIEVVEEAIINAKENQKNNNIENVTFILGKCEDEIENLLKDKNIDVLFMDPPRSGCELSFITTILASNIPQIIYISCSPQTLARDLKLLQDKYRIEEIVPVDMFSQTMHVEAVTVLERKSK